MPEQTITRPGAVLPVKVRTARTQHVCDDCEAPIKQGEQYELSVIPPHRLNEYNVGRWLTWRTHFPRHDGGRFLLGCDLAAAYAEKAEREQLTGGAGFVRAGECARLISGRKRGSSAT